MVIQGWFMVGLKSVEGWIKVHVGIQGVFIKIDRQMDGQLDRLIDCQIDRLDRIGRLDRLDRLDSLDKLDRLDRLDR